MLGAGAALGGAGPEDGRPVQTACFRAETLQPPVGARIESLAVFTQGAPPSKAGKAGGDHGQSDKADQGGPRTQGGDWVDMDATPLEKITLFVGTADGALYVYENRQPSSAASQTDMTSENVSLRLRVALKRFNPSKKAVSQLQFVEKWGILLSVLDGNLVAHHFGGEPLLQTVTHGPTEAITAELGANDLLSSRSVVCYAPDPESDFLCVAFKRLIVVLLYKVSRDNNNNNSSSNAPAASSNTNSNNGGGGAAPRVGKFRIVRQLPMAETARSMRWAGPDQICVGFAKDYTFYDVQTGAEQKRPRMRTGGRKHPLMCDVRSAPRINITASASTEAKGDLHSQEGDSSDGGSGTWNRSPDVQDSSRGEVLLCKDDQGFFVGFDGLPSRRGMASSSRTNEYSETSEAPSRYASIVDTGECVSWSEVPLAVASCQPFIVGALHRKIEIHLASSCRRTQVLTLPGCTIAYVHVLLLRTLPEMLKSLLEIAPDERKLTFALELCDAAGLAAWDRPGTSAVPATYPGAGVTAQGLRLMQADARARAALFYFRECAPRRDFRRAGQLLEGAKATGRLPIDFVVMLFARSDLFDSPEAAVTTSLNLADLRTELGELYHGHLRAARGTNALTSSASPPILAIDFEPEYVVQSSIVESTLDLCSLRGAEFALALLSVFLPFALEHRRELLAMRAQLMEGANKDKELSAESRVLASIDGIIVETLSTVDDLILRAFVLCDATAGSPPGERSRSAAGAVGGRGAGKTPGSPGSPSALESAEMRAMMAHVRDQKMRFLREENWCSVESCEQLLLQYPESWETLLWLYFGKGQHESALNWLHKLEQNEAHVVSTLEDLDEAARKESRESGETLEEPIAIAYLEYAIEQTSGLQPAESNKLASLYLRHMEHLEEAGRATTGTEQKLLTFLEKAKHLNASVLASELEGTSHYAAYALVLGRLGRHAEALRVYVDELKSLDRAEAYCARVHKSGKAGADEVFPLLVQTMIGAGNVDDALRLTERHPREVDAAKVLDLMPAISAIEILCHLVDELEWNAAKNLGGATLIIESFLGVLARAKFRLRVFAWPQLALAPALSTQI
ncbi:Transforming growth factor-beta receptor-associated protein 1 [Hondaea fermentalgiana]|uniref:Transforming growth factor-beta receptor-associated protein 1 n=1 Tax=Hondaea fermentalgiana TaxID=2315210 RepID=A0A2R5GBY3_9STRA|nr:Transforming growth factor-beta receptor-associated protein 1 [Hondaea fermentalgiana]|eukprot:GBG28500.1 Transforming growth factor-beta receptor-associated protein 1 [Hondaea fermentalgiana]